MSELKKKTIKKLKPLSKRNKSSKKHRGGSESITPTSIPTPTPTPRISRGALSPKKIKQNSDIFYNTEFRKKMENRREVDSTHGPRKN